jgi:hypothetical protein
MTMTITTFKTSRNRDAYATVRGYVYQIDRILSRWLDLRADQILELERGEDIDIVARAAGASQESERLLEQVGSLTQTSISDSAI